MELITSMSAICLTIIAIMSLNSIRLPELDPVSGRRYIYNGFFMFAYAATIIFVAAFREGFVDTRVYKKLYVDIGNNYENAFNDTVPVEDYGFNLLMIFLRRINPDPQLLIIVTSVFPLLVYTYTMNKYSADLPFSMLLFLCVGFLGSINGIRQVVASAFLLWSLPLLMKRKMVAYWLVVLLCSTFHGSAIVMIPLYFVLSGKRLNKGIWVMVALTILCFIAPEFSTRLMGEVLEDSIYKDYLENDSKMGFMRFLVELTPTVVTLVYCAMHADDDRSVRKDHPDYPHQRLLDVLINMQLVSFCFTTLGMRMVYFARISIYFPCVLALVLPVTLKGIFTEESGKTVKAIAVCLYLFYFGFQIYSFNSYSYFLDFYLHTK